ncbi:MAG: hypothetical protein AAF664_21985 [Planctomycetota bacterium]
MKTKLEKESSIATTVAVRIAGEDIAKGDYVTVLSEVIELPSFFWDCSGLSIPVDEPVRTRYMPRYGGEPCKVVAVCLPFVYTRRAAGGLTTFDTRLKQLVRLDPQSGKEVWKRLRSKKKKRKK